jgi:hypothetical protein
MRPGATGPTLVSGPGRWILYEGGGATLNLDSRDGDIGGSYITDKTAGVRARIYQYFIFRNTHIVYRGDPIVLVHVLFENCTFDIKDDQNGRQFADSILKLQYPTLRTTSG